MSFLRKAAAVLCISSLAVINSASAAVITQSGSLDYEFEVKYHQVTLSTLSDLVITTAIDRQNNRDLDTYIYLFSGSTPSVATFLGSNDDISNSNSNSMLSLTNLAANVYTLAVGVSNGIDPFTLSEAIGGTNFQYLADGTAVTDSTNCSQAASLTNGCIASSYLGNYSVSFNITPKAVLPPPPTPVPEPGMIALFGLGLLGLTFARRRQK